MPKDISTADAKAIHKTIKEALDKYGDRPGSRRKRQAADYEAVLKEAMKRIADLIA